MGGQSSSTQQTSQTQQTTPYAPAAPALQGILSSLSGMSPNLTGAETGALNTLQSSANAGNPYAAGVGEVASDLLTGGPDRTGLVGNAYDSYVKSLTPTASGAYLDPNSNPFFAGTTATIGNDVQNRINAMYAGAGRDPAGAGSYSYNLGRGIADATAPIYAQQYNNERGNQLAAINSLFSGGGTAAGLLSGLDQAKLANRQAGIGAADAATTAANYGPLQTLAIEAQRRGVPLQTLMAQAGIASPIAQAFGTTTGTGTATGTQQMSGADQFLKISAGLGNLGRILFPQPTGPR